MMMMTLKTFLQKTNLFESRYTKRMTRKLFPMRARHNDSHPKDKIANVLYLAHILWNEMEQDMLDDGIL